MSQEIKRVLVAGATGNIGKHLCDALSTKGYDVSIISRRASVNMAAPMRFIDKSIADFINKWFPGFGTILLPKDLDFTKYSWDDISKEGLPSRTDAIINLSGQPIAKPSFFTNNLKQKIFDSRIKTNNTICKAILEAENPPKVFISASAVGIYDVGTDIEYTEEMVPNEKDRATFFTNLCNEWEKSTQLPETISTRVANLRFGVNLAHDTYPMHPILIQSFGMGSGGVVGSGKQPFPWVHIEDSVGIVMFVLEKEEISGAVNVVSPSLDDNEEFTKQLAAAVKLPKQKKPMNSTLVCMLYGPERAPLLLEGQKVLPQKVLEHGYEFKHTTLVSALEEIVGRYAHFRKSVKDRIFKEAE